VHSIWFEEFASDFPGNEAETAHRLLKLMCQDFDRKLAVVADGRAVCVN